MSTTTTTTTSLSDDLGMEGVTEWLNSINKQAYAEEFKTQGYDSMEKIFSLSPDQIDEMLTKVKCKKGAMKKIKSSLAAMRPKDPKAERLKTWLAAIGLQKYVPKFESCGYLNLEDIASFSSEEIDKLINATGMKAASVQTFKKELKLQELKEQIINISTSHTQCMDDAKIQIISIFGPRNKEQLEAKGLRYWYDQVWKTADGNVDLIRGLVLLEGKHADEPLSKYRTPSKVEIQLVTGRVVYECLKNANLSAIYTEITSTRTPAPKNTEITSTRTSAPKTYVKVESKQGITIRIDATYPGNAVTPAARVNGVVEYSEVQLYHYQKYNITFYKLADGRGWIHNYNPFKKTFTGLTELRPPSESKIDYREGTRYAIISHEWGEGFVVKELPKGEDPNKFWTARSSKYSSVMFESSDGGTNWQVTTRHDQGSADKIQEEQDQHLPGAESTLPSAVEPKLTKEIVSQFKYYSSDQRRNADLCNKLSKMSGKEAMNIIKDDFVKALEKFKIKGDQAKTIFDDFRKHESTYATISGTLEIQEQGKWESRNYVLVGGSLAYTIDIDKKPQTRMIDLTDSITKNDVHQDSVFTIKIYDEVLVFRATNKVDRERWTNGIKRAAQKSFCVGSIVRLVNDGQNIPSNISQEYPWISCVATSLAKVTKAPKEGRGSVGLSFERTVQVEKKYLAIEKEKITVQFMDDKKKQWGMEIALDQSWQNWVVSSVDERKFAERRGVRQGQKISSVDGLVLNDQNSAVIKTKLQKKKSCTIIFIHQRKVKVGSTDVFLKDLPSSLTQKSLFLRNNQKVIIKNLAEKATIFFTEKCDIDASCLTQIFGPEKKCVFMIGKTGLGKSTICNSFFSQAGEKIKKFKESEKVKSCTSIPKSVYCPRLGISIVDTPGADDVRKAGEERKTNKIIINEMMQFTYQHGLKVVMFVLVLPLPGKRVDKYLQHLINSYIDIYGAGIFNRTVAVLGNIGLTINIEEAYTIYNKTFKEASDQKVFHEPVSMPRTPELKWEEKTKIYNTSDVEKQILYMIRSGDIQIRWQIRTCSRCGERGDQRFTTTKCISHISEDSNSTKAAIHEGETKKIHSEEKTRTHKKDGKIESTNNPLRYLAYAASAPLAALTQGYLPYHHYKRWDCCANASDHPGCIEHYPCCESKNEKPGCMEICVECDKPLWAKGCQEKCINCDKSWSEPGCETRETHDWKSNLAIATTTTTTTTTLSPHT